MRQFSIGPDAAAPHDTRSAERSKTSTGHSRAVANKVLSNLLQANKLFL